MFKIIATLAFLSKLHRLAADLHTRIAAKLDDLRNRVVGFALQTTAEALRDNESRVIRQQYDHSATVKSIGKDLEHDLKLAYEAHSRALQLLGERTDRNFASFQAKADKLAARRAELRKHLA